MSPESPRPRFHFTARRGWINDPLGMTYVDGQYHLFFQYVPNSTEWQPNCHWGHAVSTDLVHWTEQEVALAPGDGDGGIWSGSIIRHPEHGPMLFYTTVSIPDFAIGAVRLATPTDSTWNHWSKHDTAVVAPEELQARAFRDPYVFQDGDTWRMLVGTSLADRTAAASSFSSQDCLHWEFDGLAAQRPRTATEPVWTGSLWECPQIFTIDGKDVMITSVWDDDVLHYVAYAIGCYRDGEFQAESWHRLTYGDSYYAPSFFRDSDGQPCLVYWLRGPGGDDVGWKGALSVPHRLSLIDERLHCEPHPAALESIEREQARGGEGVRAVKWDPLAEPMTIPLGSAGDLSLEYTERVITIRTDSDEWSIPRSKDPDTVTLLVDGTVCEVFVGGSVFAVA